MIHHALRGARSVVNVGAEPADRYVLAVEPSAAMRARRDSAMAIFTVHQWPDPAGGLAEVRRVTRGPVVVMTLDVEAPSDFWLAEYVPERRAVEQDRFPTVADIRAAQLGWQLLSDDVLATGPLVLITANP